MLTVVPPSPVIGQLGKAVSSCLAGVCGAAVIAAATGTVAASAGALVGGAFVAGTGAAAFTVGAFVGVGLLSIGAGFALGYTIKNGVNSTPQGAWKAFGAGVTIIQHPEDPIEAPSYWPSSLPPLPGPLSFR